MTPFVYVLAASLVVAGLLGRRIGRDALANARLTSRRELRLRSAQAERLVSGTAHDELASLVRMLEDARALLDRAGDAPSLRLSAALTALLAVCQQVRADVRSSAYPDELASPERARSYLVDRWGRIEKAPAWWPQSLRDVWVVSFGAWLDSIRQLHTREIERVALTGTLVLRAVILLASPFAAALAIAGVVPFSDDASTAGDWAWAICTGWALAVAVGSRRLVDRVLDPTRETLRLTLAVFEGALAVVLLLTVPSWLSFAFVAGPINWLMRPWRARKLGVSLAAALAVLAAGLELQGDPSPAAVVAELLLSVLVLGLISNSYGLMLPLVVGHVFFVMPSWHLASRRFERKRWERRARSLTAALADATAVAAEERGGSPAVAEIAPQLEAARMRIEETWTPRRARAGLLFRRRTLAEVVAEGLGGAAGDPGRPLRLASPIYTPSTLAERRLRSWRGANQLEIALRRIGLESVRHGEFEIRCSCSLVEDGGVHVRIENDLPVDAPTVLRRQGRGEREIAAAVGQLPGGTPGRRDFDESELGLPVFAVEFTFSSTMLAEGR